MSIDTWLETAVRPQRGGNSGREYLIYSFTCPPIPYCVKCIKFFFNQVLITVGSVQISTLSSDLLPSTRTVPCYRLFTANPVVLHIRAVRNVLVNCDSLLILQSQYCTYLTIFGHVCNCLQELGTASRSYTETYLIISRS